MSISIDPQQPRENRLLAALSDREYERLIPHLESVSLSRHQVLYDTGEEISHVYFPNQAMISLVSIMADGAIVEVGIVGKEGMAGMPVCWGGNATINQAMVQISGTAMRMKAEQLLTEFNRDGALHSLLLRYTQALYTHTTQTAACRRAICALAADSPRSHTIERATAYTGIYLAYARHTLFWCYGSC